jgi:ribosome-associated protein
MKEFELKEDYIELIKLLKLIGVAESGAYAKMMVEEGRVLRNGKVETRKRAKLRKGDIIKVDSWTIGVK